MATYQTLNGFFPAEQTGQDQDGRPLYRAVADGHPNFHYRDVGDGLWAEIFPWEYAVTLTSAAGDDVPGSFQIDLLTVGRFVRDDRGVTVAMHQNPYERFRFYGGQAAKVAAYVERLGLSWSSMEDVRAAEARMVRDHVPQYPRYRA